MAYRPANDRELEKRAAWRAASAGKRFQLFNTELGGGLRLRKNNDTATPHCAVRTSPAHETRWCGARASVNPRSRCLGDTPVVASAWPLPALQQPLDEQGCLRKKRRLAHLNAGCTNGAQLPPNSGGGQEKNAGGSLMLSMRPPPSLPNGW